MKATLDRLETALSALVYRVQRIEASPTQPECCRARAVAAEVGLDMEVVCRMEQGEHEDRVKLMRELRHRNWSTSSIARAFRCTEKTVERALRT